MAFALSLFIYIQHRQSFIMSSIEVLPLSMPSIPLGVYNTISLILT